jgi:hypothetical protein
MIARTARRIVPVIALLSLVMASTAGAQLGGLKKKLAKAGGVGGTPTTTTNAHVNVVVTPEVIDHYLAGLKARKAERGRIATTNTPVGKYYAAEDAYRAHQKHCEEFNQKRSENYSRLIAQQKYDSAGAAMTARDASCETGMAEPQEPDFQELTRARGSEDTAAAVGAGMDVNSWASLDEWIPDLMNQMVNSPERSTAELASNFGRKPSEIEALKARKDEVAAALGIPPKQKPVEQPQMAAPQPQMTAPAAGAASPGMTAGGAQCMQTEMNAQKPALEAMGKRAQAARDANDMNKAMAIADSISQINMAIMRKCGMTK